MPGGILVTGAAGFAGGHLLDLLKQQPTPVVGWRRPGSRNIRSAPSNVSRLATAQPAQNAEGDEEGRDDIQWMSVELLDRQAVIDAIAQIQPSAVYHLAGSAHVAQSWQNTLHTYQGNVLAMQHLLVGLREAGLRPRVLAACSGTVYAPQDRPITETDPLAPASPYATSKLAQEMLARRAWEDDGIPALIARAFNHIGPGQDPSYVTAGIARQVARIEAGMQGPVLTLGNLEPKRDLTDVRDTVRAYVAMMARARPGVPYNVCSGRPLSIGSVVETFVARAKTPIRIVQDPALLRPNDTPVMVGDPALLTADTGWTAQVRFEESVDQLLDYWRHRIRQEA
jgi:GDP-4-dehydro-6-deoxy-D-mannose reductase